MALDVDWAGTDANPFRIFVPRADMPIVQASPEIRELNVDQFRKDLRTIEATAPGAPWPETHLHKAESTLSGTTFARSVEVLSPYQVEFEDGQYSVRAVGANHNILDVKVNNQVSLAVVLSAGLINPTNPAAIWDEDLGGGSSLDARTALLRLAVALGHDPDNPVTATKVGEALRKIQAGPAGNRIIDQTLTGDPKVSVVTKQTDP